MNKVLSEQTCDYLFLFFLKLGPQRCDVQYDSVISSLWLFCPPIEASQMTTKMYDMGSRKISLFSLSVPKSTMFNFTLYCEQMNRRSFPLCKVQTYILTENCV